MPNLPRKSAKQSVNTALWNSPVVTKLEKGSVLAMRAADALNDLVKEAEQEIYALGFRPGTEEAKYLEELFNDLDDARAAAADTYDTLLKVNQTLRGFRTYKGGKASGGR